VHVKGVENEVADSLSRNRLDLVFRLRPPMEQSPEVVDEEMLQVVVKERQAGRDPDWMRLCKSSFGRD